MEKRIKELENYEKGFYILMDYWDSIPDEEKVSVHEKLIRLGL